jgi:hypothetical protein
MHLSEVFYLMFAPHAIFVLTILGLVLSWYEEQNFTQLDQNAH